MAVFSYTALSGDGRQMTGSLPAESRAAAVAAVMGKGLHPVRVAEAGVKTAEAPVKAAPGGRVSQKHIESFTREMANLLGGGVPLARALFLLRRETAAPGPKALCAQIHDDVVGGMALADALALHPKAFSKVYVAMVRAGEAGGFLELVLGQIAEFRAREQDLKGKVVSAMVYPCVLAVLATAVLVFLLTFFIPKFSPIFTQYGSSLPVLTQIILVVSHFVLKYGLFVLGGIVLGVFLLRRALRTESGKRRMERLVLRSPGLGTVIAHFALVRFCRMLGTLLISGVPLVTALKVAKEAIGNQTLADTVGNGIEQVQRGASLAQSLADAKQLFPSSVIEMITIAEETGRLDKELVRLATSYESELDRKLRMLVSLAEPLLLLIMAGLIGTVVLGMLLPVFNLQELIK